jgi:hypothetical protein
MARPNKQWFQESKCTWYCTLDGRKVSLAVQGRENAKAATEARHRRLADARPGPDKAEPTVPEIVKQFLGDCEGRAEPKTLQGFRDFLTPFSERHGNLKAAPLTPMLAEAVQPEARVVREHSAGLPGDAGRGVPMG